MRLKSFSCHNVGPLRNVALDFERDVGPGIIAICGATGEGKSTLTGLLGPALFYQEMPYYERSVFDHIADKGWAESNYDFDGTEVTFRIEGERGGKTRRAYVSNGTHRAGPLLGPCLELARTYVPSPELTYATYYAAQGNGGSIFRLKEAKRREVLIELLDLSRFEAWAKLAGRQQRQTKGTAETLAASLAALRERVERRTALLTEMDIATGALAELREQGPRHDAMLLAARTAHQTLKEAHAAATATREAIEREIAGFRVEQAKIQRRIADAERAMTVTPGDPADAERLQASLLALQERLTQHQDTLTAAEAELDTASARVVAKQAEAATMRQQTTEAEQESRRARDAFLRESKQLQALTEALTGVDLSIEMCQVCPLTAQGREASARLDTITREHRATLQRLNDAISTLTDQQLALANVIGEAEDQRAAVEATVTPLRAEQTATQQAIAETQANWQRTLTLIQAGQAAVKAAGELQQWRVQLDSIEQAIVDGEARVAAVPKVDPMELSNRRTAEVAAERQLASWREMVSLTEQKLAGLAGQLRELDDAPAVLTKAEQEVVALGTRATQFGTLQAAWQQVRWAMIDAACPSIETLANDLLAGYDAGRFRIALPTAVQKKDGKGEMDGLIPRVIDTRADAVREGVSGGETSICDEALRDAIAIYRTQRIGRQIQTIFRDEPTSAFDADSASFYADMLRRFYALSGAYQLLAVTHSPEMQAAADRRIWIRDGRVTVE